MAATAGDTSALASRLAVLRPLRQRNFALLMAGRTTSNMGRMMRQFARGWLVLEMTGSPFLLGVVAVSLTLPEMFMPFFAGVVADRVDRRKLLLYTEFMLVVLWVAVSVDITLGYIEWWHLSVSAIFSGMIQSFGRTGHQAILGNVVSKEDLARAVAIDSVAQQWPNAGGLLVATLVIGTIGVEGVFWITAFGQLVTGITLLLMHWQYQKPVEARRGRNFQRDFLEGIRYIRGETVLVGLVLIGAVATLFGGATQFLLPVFARDILGVGAQGLGVLMLFSTLGVSFGSLVVVGVSSIPRRGRILLGAVILGTLVRVGFSYSEIFYLSLGLVFAFGITSTLRQTMVRMIMQLMAPDHLRGRVMSLQISMQGLSWIGVLALGALAEFVGAAHTMAIGAVVSGLITVFVFAVMPSLRRFN
ncbi:MAG: MFS transporter [Chloroflexi bacterium]|nr:MFS transporter [Chloroflexota bacterium]